MLVLFTDRFSIIFPNSFYVYLQVTPLRDDEQFVFIVHAPNYSFNHIVGLFLLLQ